MSSQLHIVGSTPSGQPNPAILFDLNTGNTQEVTYELLSQDTTYRFPQEGEGYTTTTTADGVSVEYVLLNGSGGGGSNSGTGGGGDRRSDDEFDLEGQEEPDKETVQRFAGYSEEGLREIMTQSPYFFASEDIAGLPRNELLLKIEMADMGHENLEKFQ